MRVLHVISGLPRAAGTSVFCAELCNHLSLQGVASCIAVHQKSESDYLPHSSVPVFEVERCPYALPFKPEIVHIHALWDPFLHRASVWARRASLPIVYSPHGMLAPWAMHHKRWKKTLPWYVYQKRDLKKAVMLHATSEKEASWIRDLGFSQEIVVAPLGTHVPLRVSPRDHTPKAVLFVGRIYPVKGLSHLITAWSRLPNETRRDWQVRLVGPDQAGHMGELKRLADRLGVSQEVRLLGPLFGEQLESEYRDADVFVLPSFTENFGGVVVDAMSYCLPVITTKGTPWAELLGNSGQSTFVNESGCALVEDDQKSENGRPETIDEGRETKQKQLAVAVGYGQGPRMEPSELMNFRMNELARTGRAGWWIDIGVEPLAKALQEALGLSDERRREMGENGRRLVEAKYTWPTIARDMKRAYGWMLEGGEMPEYARI